jgi:D-alanyl-D-alanine carboxypeptidase/D-alanyl-D-alanine-endopeptidase (penicillin-binding protein 4)
MTFPNLRTISILAGICLLRPVGAALAESVPSSVPPSSSVDTAASHKQVADALDAVLAAPLLEHAFVGAMVVSLRSGETWYSHNADKRFMPASNTKLFTTSSALEYLDPRQRFQTRVVLTGKVSQQPDNWNGDLILVGGGDPSLKATDLEQLARDTATSGIRLIWGDLLTDATLFQGPGRGPGWGWDWEGDYYAAPASALTVNEGRLEVTVKPADKDGRAPAVTLFPDASGHTVVNRATTGPADSKLDVTIMRRHTEPVIEVTGNIPLHAPPYSDEIAVDDPETLAGRVFRDALSRAGVRIMGVLGKREKGASSPRITEDDGTMAQHTSQTLGVLLREMNLPSDNHYAEIMLRHVGVAWSKKQGEAGKTVSADTLDQGLAAESAFLKQIGISEEEVFLKDGSGLSRLNVVTPRSVVQLIQAMKKHRNGDLLFGSLPLSGRSGTLKNRMKGTPAEANVHAKTGTFTEASALSGIVYTRSGEPLAFSLLMNQFLGSATPIRALQDRFCSVLADE